MDKALVESDIFEKSSTPSRLVPAGGLWGAGRGTALTIAQWRRLTDIEKRQWLRANVQASPAAVRGLLGQIENQLARDAAGRRPKIKPWIAAGISESTWYRRKVSNQNNDIDRRS
jgi:hypothetical protein